MADESTFVQGMRLTPREIDVLERHVGMIEQAAKNRMDFLKGDVVAFTPGALLAVAVARFAYEVYRDYGSVALRPEDLQMHFKSIAQELVELETNGEEALSLDVYARLRRDLVAAKKTSRG